LQGIADQVFEPAVAIDHQAEASYQQVLGRLTEDRSCTNLQNDFKKLACEHARHHHFKPWVLCASTRLLAEGSLAGQYHTESILSIFCSPFLL